MEPSTRPTSASPLQSINSGYANTIPVPGFWRRLRGERAVAAHPGQLSFVAFGSYNYLADTVANSPIPITGPGGSRNQFVAGAALTGAFPVLEPVALELLDPGPRLDLPATRCGAG